MSKIKKIEVILDELSELLSELPPKLNSLVKEVKSFLSHHGDNAKLKEPFFTVDVVENMKKQAEASIIESFKAIFQLNDQDFDIIMRDSENFISSFKGELTYNPAIEALKTELLNKYRFEDVLSDEDWELIWMNYPEIISALEQVEKKTKKHPYQQQQAHQKHCLDNESANSEVQVCAVAESDLDGHRNIHEMQSSGNPVMITAFSTPVTPVITAAVGVPIEGYMVSDAEPVVASAIAVVGHNDPVTPTPVNTGAAAAPSTPPGDPVVATAAFSRTVASQGSVISLDWYLLKNHLKTSPAKNN